MSLVKANTYQDASGGSNAVFSGVASPPNSMGFRNRIINGDMRIDQRNAGAATANTISGYTLDRWAVSQSTTGKLIAQQNAGSVTPPAGFKNYLGVTSQSAYSVAAGDYYMIYQMIEGNNVADLGFGAAGAATITISFWVRSSLTGTFGGSLQNNATNRSYPFTYTISAANTWEQKTLTIAGDTTGSWETGTGTGIRIQFGLGVGSTYSGTAGSWAGSNLITATGAVSVVGTNGATFYITGVQLEAGTNASAFERRDYGRELAMCQRYYYRISAANGSGTYTKYGIGFARSSTRYDMMLNTPVTMRAAPTSLDTSAANTFLVYDGGSDLSVSGLAFDQQNLNTIVLNITVSGATQYRSGNLQANNNSTSYLGLGAEL
jgi:hypothetical protein